MPDVKRYDIINHFIRLRGYASYLEIGTGQGECLHNVLDIYKVSVDPDPDAPASHHMTSDQYFSSFRKHFDIVFIDGLHTHQQAYRDIQNALKRLNPGGMVIVHDCLPTNEYMQRQAKKYPGGLWTGDVWKAFVRSRSESQHECYTIDTDFGCGIIDTAIQKSSDTSDLPYDMESMTYDQFVRNRNVWMNVKGDVLNA